jgi:uncharacterized protein (TIGR02996 family)
MAQRCTWSAEDEAWLEARLREANGKRTARTLDARAVHETVERLLSGDARWLVHHGGDVDDGRQHTTLCLCVKTARGVVVGVGTSRTGPASPERAFADLAGWDAWTLKSNDVRCERWATRRAADRRELVVTRSGGSLLDAVLERPDDDAPRLVYADWLAEQGDPRGEFILVQCELARTGVGEARRAALEERAQQLLDAHRAQWLGPLTPEAASVSFERGFLSELTVHDADAVEAALPALAKEPVSVLVFASRRRVDVSRVLTWPWLATVRTLDFRTSRSSPVPMGREGLATLLSTRLLRRLTTFALTGQWVRDEGAVMLGETDAFGALTELTLASDALTSSGVEALSKASWFAGLRRLSLADDGLGPDSAALLARVRFKRLARLNLASNRIGNEGALALTRSQHLKSLESLWLASNRIGVSGAEALLDADAFAKTQLVLDGNPMGARNKERLRSRGPTW